MNKRHITLSILLILILFLMAACTKKTSKDMGNIHPNDGKDTGMNIIHSEKNIETIPVSTKREKFKLEDIIDEKIEKALAMGRLGEVEYLEEGGYFEVNANSIDYLNKEGNARIENVKGVVINPPDASITDSYYDMSYYLEEEDVLFILLDGFGYHQYKYAIEKGYLPFLGKQPEAAKALSVYKPVTNAGLAAMLTGKFPIENGVHSRKQRELQVDSIFKLAEGLGKKAIYIEGDIGILKTEIEPVLNLDNNGDGFTDDEVFESTLKAINEDHNLVFTHFHGIDDTGHTHGDLSIETMEFIKRVDGYVEELVSNWNGKVIITADHGMHSTEDGGDHGEFRYEDMVVPYMILDGGNHFD